MTGDLNNSQKNQKFINDYEALQMVFNKIHKSISLIKKLEKDVNSFTPSDIQHLISILGEHIISQLSILLDETGLTLKTLPRKYKKSFNHTFFNVYQKELDEFIKEHEKDISRIKNNRHNAGIGHIGYEDKLGVSEEEANILESSFQVKNVPVVEEELQFISPKELLGMKIMENLNILRNILYSLDDNTKKLRMNSLL